MKAEESRGGKKKNTENKRQEKKSWNHQTGNIFHKL